MLRRPWYRCDQEHCYSRMMGCYYIVGLFLHQFIGLSVDGYSMWLLYNLLLP